MKIVENQKKLHKEFELEIKEITALIHNFKKLNNRTDHRFLDIGFVLVEIQRQHTLDDEVFTKLKLYISKLIGINGLRNLNKVISTAQSDIIQKHRSKLPKDWVALYLLSKQENLLDLIETGTIKNDMPLSVIKQKIKSKKASSA
jgi:hypothetical protein